jgi:hypothetical protein
LPVEVARGVLDFAAGSQHLLTIGVDGQMTGWGANEQGQLGGGTAALRWHASKYHIKFAQIASGAAHTVALDTQGSIWAWGANSDGQLGLGPNAKPVVANPTRTGAGLTPQLAIAPASATLPPVLKAYANGAAMLNDKPVNFLTEDTHIRLSRGACYGSCPVYQLDIRGNGEVTLQESGSEHREVVKQHITAEQVAALLAAFRDIRFFSLQDDYASTGPNCPSRQTDGPGVRVDLQLGRFQKSIGHYHGCVGKPVLARLSAFEDRIDQIVGTQKLIEDNSLQSRMPPIPSPAVANHCEKPFS